MTPYIHILRKKFPHNFQYSKREHKVIVVSTVTFMLTNSFPGQTAEMSVEVAQMEEKQQEQQEQQEERLTRHQRHYARHREEKLQKVKDRYHSRPDVMARDALRAQKREEKARLAAEKEVRRMEREQRLKERFERFKSSSSSPLEQEAENV